MRPSLTEKVRVMKTKFKLGDEVWATSIDDVFCGKIDTAIVAGKDVYYRINGVRVAEENVFLSLEELRKAFGMRFHVGEKVCYWDWADEELVFAEIVEEKGVDYLLSSDYLLPARLAFKDMDEAERGIARYVRGILGKKE